MNVLRPKDPKKLANARIRHAAGVVVVLTGLRIVGHAIRLSNAELARKLHFDWTGFLECGIVMVAAFGLFRRSRLCAILLTCYFTFDIGVRVTTPAAGGLSVITAMALVYTLVLCVRAIPATFRYHQLEKNKGYCQVSS